MNAKWTTKFPDTLSTWGMSDNSRKSDQDIQSLVLYFASLDLIQPGDNPGTGHAILPFWAGSCAII